MSDMEGTGETARIAGIVEREFGVRLDRSFAGATRSGRWVGTDAQHVVLVALCEAAQQALARERLVLDQLAHAGCATPRVLASSSGLQLRTKLLGLIGPEAEAQMFADPPERVAGRRYDSALPISAAGRRLAADLGHAVGRIHRAFGAREAAAIGVPRFRFEPAKYRAAVAGVVPAGLREAFDRVAARTDAEEDAEVLCHGDLNHHNVASEPGTGALIGLFDLEEMVIAEPALDFKFFPSNGLAFTTIAIDAYAEETGVRLSMDRIQTLHILAAAENLTYALTHPAHGIARCRTWLEDALRWSTTSREAGSP